ncbi:MAG: ArsR/SmtB family transcription factor [Halolamina sp.]
MNLLPSTPDPETDDAEPRVVGVDSDEADRLVSALSSATSRDLLTALHEKPATPSTLADRVDTSLQNAQYHLEKLADAGVVEVADTAYSEKGREMDVYVPTDEPLVVVAGGEETTSTLRTALSRLLGAVGALAGGSLLVQQLVGGGLGGLVPFSGGAGGAEGADLSEGGAATQETATSTPIPTETPATTATEAGAGVGGAETETAREAATTAATATPTPAPEPTAAADAVTTAAAAADGAGLPPGVVFFLGGLTVLAVVVVAAYGPGVR